MFIETLGLTCYSFFVILFSKMLSKTFSKFWKLNEQLFYKFKSYFFNCFFRQVKPANSSVLISCVISLETVLVWLGRYHLEVPLNLG